MKRIVSPPRTLQDVDDFYADIQNNIDKYGFHIMGVMAGHHTPPFNYTIGLSEKLGYELFMCGLRNDYSAQIIHIYVDNALQGLYRPDCVIPKEVVSNFPMMVAECNKELDWLYSDFTLQIERFYKERKRVVQLIMADKDGHTLRDPEFNIEFMAQFQPIFCEVN